jgi:dUTPase
VKHFIDTGAGVVDEDYRGPLKVLLFNHGDTDFPGRIHLWTQVDCSFRGGQDCAVGVGTDLYSTGNRGRVVV